MTAKRTPRYLRSMVEVDLTEVMRGELATYPHPWTLKNFEDCLQHQNYSCWVFEQDKKIEGHAILSIAAGETHILNLCVYPDIQGQGWGKKLLSDVELIARQHRSESCFLEVRESNDIGLNLYNNAGYNEIGVRNNYYPTDKGREDAIVMAKQLF